MIKTIKNVLYIIGGIICLLFSVGIFITLWNIVHSGVFLIFGFGLACIFFPFLIRHGLKTLYKERAAIQNVLSRNVEIRYNCGRIFRGFAEVLSLFWLIVPATFIIPAAVLVAVVLIPISVAMLVVEIRVCEIWEDIGWSKGLYWLINIGIYVFGIILGLCINILIY